MKVSFIKTGNGNITLVINSKNYSISKSHPNYASILEALKTRKYAGLESLLDIPKSINQTIGVKTNGAVTVRDGQVFFHDLPMHNTVTERILAFLSEGLPIEPLVKFLENLMANPMPMAVAELFDFLDHEGFPITEDGCFIGYKGLNDNFTDRHTGTVDNTIGKRVWMDRKLVDPDRRNQCSTGYHVGTLKYASEFGPKVVLVKVNPKDCIAVPKDHDCSKLRLCEYLVLSEAQGLIETPMYPMPAIRDESCPECDSADCYDLDCIEEEIWDEDKEIDQHVAVVTLGTFNTNSIISNTVSVPKRPACRYCGAKGGKKHAANCRRP